MAADGHLGYTKMAITSQPLCRSTWCSVLVWSFRVGRSNGATFSDLEWPRTPVSRSQYSLKANMKYLANGACHGQIYQCFMRLRWVNYPEDNIIPDSQWRSSSFQESKKVPISRDLWPWPWAHPGCTLTWRPSCESLVAIRPFACEKKRFAQKFTDRRTDRRTDRQTDRRRTPRHCISSYLEWANNHIFTWHERRAVPQQ